MNGTRNRPERGGSPPLSRGTSQFGVRLYNERLVLSLIRRHRILPKAEIASLTGLSAQTVSVIVRRLEAEGLLKRHAPKRGKVGQPLVPFSLNPEGAFAIGIKVGRRSSDMLSLDLGGQVHTRHGEVHSYPTPENIIGLARSGLRQIARELGPRRAKRIVGVGIAAPFEMWNWEQEVGAPHNAMEAWRGVDIAAEIAAISDWPVSFCNDATAACAAELLFGRGQALRDFAYFYIGYFVGGGIALNGSLFQGRTGYAGAMGPMPVPVASGTEQLIRHASIYKLERMLEETGFDPFLMSRHPDDWRQAEAVIDAWIGEVARSLALAALAAVSVIDFEAVIIDGALPPDIRARIVAAVRRSFALLDTRGIAPVQIAEGSIGNDAGAMGGAALALLSNFAIDRDVLFKEAASPNGS